MSKIHDRWDELHAQLQDDYLAADGVYPADSAEIANELVGLLHERNTDAGLWVVKANVDAAQWRAQTFGENVSTPELITPTPYDGRIRWASHIVCVDSFNVYDPMLPRPQQLVVYPLVAFEEQVRMLPIEQADEI